MQANRVFIIIGGVLLVIGARLPWISVPILFGVEGPAYEAIEIGWEGDGFITGGIGLILLLGGLFLGEKPIFSVWFLLHWPSQWLPDAFGGCLRSVPVRDSLQLWMWAST